jgi:DNA repair exonuclease SbcCD ATPase subunit
LKGGISLNSFKINKLIINNIQSYYGKHVINFNDLNNFILINGKNKSSEKQSNGSGKSTLFKSIIYGLGILKRTPKTIKSKGSTDESEIGIELFNDKTNEKFQIVKTIFDDNKPSTL